MDVVLGSAPVFVVLNLVSVRTFQSSTSANVVQVTTENSLVSEPKPSRRWLVAMAERNEGITIRDCLLSRNWTSTRWGRGE